MKTMWLFLALAAGTISPAVFASDDFSPEQIRELVNQGRILPLQTLLEKHAEQIQGRLLDLEVENEHGRIVYELEYLRDNGDVVELVIDAENGELLKSEVDR